MMMKNFLFILSFFTIVFCADLVTGTPAPTVTPAPSLLPTESPSAAPTALSLFAIVGPNTCAETLYYGPEPLTPTGTSNGLYQYYVSTLDSNTALSNTWVQVVTQTDGVTEYFRLYWSFSDMMTVEDRFLTAQNTGVYVDYTLVEPDGTTTLYTNVQWRFSDSAGLTAQKFAVTSTTYGFSADDGK
jgi:hypothetical protein